MPNLQELRNKARDLKIWGRSKMKREELKKAIAAVAGENWYEEDLRVKKQEERDNWYKENVHCKDCLLEQYKQKKIDEETYNQRLLEQAFRDLCKWCNCKKLACDGDLLVCTKCGTLQDSIAEGFRFY